MKPIRLVSVLACVLFALLLTASHSAQGQAAVKSTTVTPAPFDLCNTVTVVTEVAYIANGGDAYIFQKFPGGCSISFSKDNWCANKVFISTFIDPSDGLPTVLYRVSHGVSSCPVTATVTLGCATGNFLDITYPQPAVLITYPDGSTDYPDATLTPLTAVNVSIPLAQPVMHILDFYDGSTYVSPANLDDKQQLLISTTPHTRTFDLFVGQGPIKSVVFTYVPEQEISPISLTFKGYKNGLPSGTGVATSGSTIGPVAYTPGFTYTFTSSQIGLLFPGQTEMDLWDSIQVTETFLVTSCSPVPKNDGTRYSIDWNPCPRTICVLPDANGVLHTSPHGDDVLAGAVILAGAGSLKSYAAPDDVLSFAMITPNAAGIGNVLNSTLDPLDVPALSVITAGPNGICDTIADPLDRQVTPFGQGGCNTETATRYILVRSSEGGLTPSIHFEKPPVTSADLDFCPEVLADIVVSWQNSPRDTSYTDPGDFPPGDDKLLGSAEKSLDYFMFPFKQDVLGDGTGGLFAGGTIPPARVYFEGTGLVAPVSLSSFPGGFYTYNPGPNAIGSNPSIPPYHVLIDFRVLTALPGAYVAGPLESGFIPENTPVFNELKEGQTFAIRFKNVAFVCSNALFYPTAQYPNGFGFNAYPKPGDGYMFFGNGGDVFECVYRDMCGGPHDQKTDYANLHYHFPVTVDSDANVLPNPPGGQDVQIGDSALVQFQYACASTEPDPSPFAFHAYGTVSPFYFKCSHPNYQANLIIPATYRLNTATYYPGLSMSDSSSPFSLPVAATTPLLIHKAGNPAVGALTIGAGGVITAAAITSGGWGYTTPPAVSVNANGSGSGAVITANLSGGSVVSLTVSAGGSGYSSTATLSIAPPPLIDYYSYTFALPEPPAIPAPAYTGHISANVTLLTCPYGSFGFDTFTTEIQAICGDCHEAECADTIAVIHAQLFDHCPGDCDNDPAPQSTTRFIYNRLNFGTTSETGPAVTLQTATTLHRFYPCDGVEFIADGKFSPLAGHQLGFRMSYALSPNATSFIPFQFFAFDHGYLTFTPTGGTAHTYTIQPTDLNTIFTTAAGAPWLPTDARELYVNFRDGAFLGNQDLLDALQGTLSGFPNASLTLQVHIFAKINPMDNVFTAGSYPLEITGEFWGLPTGLPAKGSCDPGHKSMNVLGVTATPYAVIFPSREEGVCTRSFEIRTDVQGGLPAFDEFEGEYRAWYTWPSSITMNLPAGFHYQSANFTVVDRYGAYGPYPHNFNYPAGYDLYGPVDVNPATATVSFHSFSVGTLATEKNLPWPAFDRDGLPMNMRIKGTLLNDCAITTQPATGTVTGGGIIATGGAITGFLLTSGGSGYTTPPLVTVYDPTGMGSGAVITAQISTGGSVVGFTIVSPGSGYSSAATLIIDPPSTLVPPVQVTLDWPYISSAYTTDPGCRKVHAPELLDVPPAFPAPAVSLATDQTTYMITSLPATIPGPGITFTYTGYPGSSIDYAYIQLSSTCLGITKIHLQNANGTVTDISSGNGFFPLGSIKEGYANAAHITFDIDSFCVCNPPVPLEVDVAYGFACRGYNYPACESGTYKFYVAVEESGMTMEIFPPTKSTVGNAIGNPCEFYVYTNRLTSTGKAAVFNPLVKLVLPDCMMVTGAQYLRSDGLGGLQDLTTPTAAGPRNSYPQNLYETGTTTFYNPLPVVGFRSYTWDMNAYGPGPGPGPNPPPRLIPFPDYIDIYFTVTTVPGCCVHNPKLIFGASGEYLCGAPIIPAIPDVPETLAIVSSAVAPTVTLGTLGTCYPTLAAAEAAAIAATTATDNCLRPLTKTASTTGPLCAAAIRVTATSCGTQAYVDYLNVRIDNMPPTLTAPPNKTGANHLVGCDTTVITPLAYSATAKPIILTDLILAGGSAGDDCGLATITYQDSKAGTCPIVVTRTFNATDFCQHTATATQTLEINDTVAPAFSGLPAATLALTCLADLPVVPTVTANDNCDGTVAVTYAQNPVTPVGSCNTIITRTWTASDSCHNTATFIQTITVHDNVPPAFSGLPAATLALTCLAYLPTVPAVTATDNCDGAVVVNYAQNPPAPMSSCHATIMRTWTATDSCHNTATFTQTITIDDFIRPTIVCPPDVVLPLGSPTTPADTGSATATDNCGLPPTITSTDAPIPPPCTGGTPGIARTWTAQDNCLNTATCVQHITFDCSTNCCDNCTTNDYVSFTIHILANVLYSLENPLCHGTNNTLGAVLPNVPDSTTVYKYGTGGFTSYDYDGTIPDWSDPTVSLKPGEGFMLKSPVAFDLTFFGCEPTNCPLPCLPTNGYILVGGMGLSTATWTHLSSCPPKCGTRMSIFNGSGYDTYEYLNDVWIPNEPVLAVAHSGFVYWAADTNCCCNDCVTNSDGQYPACYTVTVESGFNFLVNHLCHGKDNTLGGVLADDPLGTIPHGTFFYKWNGSAFTSYAFDDVNHVWSDPNLLLEPGEGFALYNPDLPFVLTFCGCEPTCPRPCLSTNGCTVVGRRGIGTATWTDLSSCPPVCETRVSLFDPIAQSYDTYDYLNGAWTLNGASAPQGPILALGQSAWVCVQANPKCCTNTCADSKTVPCGQVWHFDPPTFSKECCSNVVVLLLSSNVIFESRCQTVFEGVWQIVDCNDHISTCTQTVTVVDLTPPVITKCPPDRTLFPDYDCVVLVPDMRGELVATDNCSGVTVEQDPLPNSLFGPGLHPVVFTVCDACTNCVKCTNYVGLYSYVTFNCPTNITVDCTNDLGTVVTYAYPSPISLCCPGPMQVTCTPDSGQVFHIGVTPTTCTAVDACGNTNVCTFAVTVVGHGFGEWKWAKEGGCAGNPGDDLPASGNAVAVDKQGNVFVTGFFNQAMNFPDFPGPSLVLPFGGFYTEADTYLAKYDAAGLVQWAVRAGGRAGDSSGNGATVDEQGNVYITGGFRGTAQFPATFASYSPTIYGGTVAFSLISSGGTANEDIFVAKYDPNGVCLWVKTAGGTGDDFGAGIAWTPIGDKVFVTGTWGSASSPNVQQAFVLEITGVSGLAPVVGTPVLSSPAVPDSSQYARARAIAVDQRGNPYVAGVYRGATKFPPGTALCTLPATAGAPRAFAARFDGSLACVWATHSGYPGTVAASGYADATGIAVDRSGAFCYVTAYFLGTANFGNSGSGDVFVTNLKGNSLNDYLIAKLLTANGKPQWAINGDPGGLRPASDDETRAIATDPDGNPCVTGFLHPNAGTPFVNDGPTVLVKSYDKTAGTLLWTRNADDGLFGLNDPRDVGYSIAIDGAGCAHISGEFSEDLNFPPLSPSLFPSTLRDMFVAKMCPTCAPLSPCPGSPKLNVAQVGSNIVLSWSGGGYHLEGATVLANPSSATVWTSIPGTSPITRPASGAQMFFRLVCP